MGGHAGENSARVPGGNGAAGDSARGESGAEGHTKSVVTSTRQSRIRD